MGDTLFRDTGSARGLLGVNSKEQAQHRLRSDCSYIGCIPETSIGQEALCNNVGLCTVCRQILGSRV